MFSLIKSLTLSTFVVLAATISLSAEEGSSGSDAVRYLGMELSNVLLQTEKESGHVIYVRPNELILGQADVNRYRPQHYFEFTQVIVGFAGIGAQDGIVNGQFSLIAPAKEGVYEVRFRYAQAYSIESAVESWWDVDSPPPEQATIALVIVTNDPENAERTIHDGNWKEWVKSQYDTKQNVSAETVIEPLLTSDMVNGAEFWGQRVGDWMIAGAALHNRGTLRYNQHNRIISKNAYEAFNLRVTENYYKTRNFERAWWSHARGFGIVYYVSDERNVEFRYFADVGQLSLYIRDGEKVVEHMVRAYFEEGEAIVHDIVVDGGKISWIVNNSVIFEKETTLKQGHLMLTNHNNAVYFNF